MSTNPVVGTIATVAGAAASGPASLLGAIASIAKPLIDLIPDPQKKLEAQQHIADQQQALALAQIDQQNKIIAATSDNVKADPHSSGARAYFCYGITTLILANYGIIPLVNAVFHSKMTPFEIPSNVLWIFATIMLGFVGVPSVMETLKSVMGMPGESQVSVLGVKVGNKS
jgi:hypothetical protein